MSVQVENIVEYEDSMSFNIRNVETCLVNSLRRTCLSNIECLVFKGFPHNESSINIIKNTTNFNNEYLKHRISCIPIMNRNVSEFQQFKENYKIVLDVKSKKYNESQEKVYVTTDDIVIINKNSGNALPKEETEKLFPRNIYSDNHILICVLYPNHNINDDNIEELHLEAEFEIGCAAQNSCWNVVHNCTYEFLRNEEEIAKIANTIEDKSERKDFEILDAQKHYYQNEYKMTIQSLGIFTNREIMQKCCQYIIKKLELIIQYSSDNEMSKVQTKDEFISSSTDGTKTMEELEESNNSYCNIYLEGDFFVFELKEDDYTIGKLIEVYLYKNNEDVLDFVGFKKQHPIQPDAHIYIHFKNSQNIRQNNSIFALVNDVAQKLIAIFQNIQTQFITN